MLCMGANVVGHVTDARETLAVETEGGWDLLG
jgi:hypothetical protein